MRLKSWQSPYLSIKESKEDAYGDEITHHLPLHPKGAVWHLVAENREPVPAGFGRIWQQRIRIFNGKIMDQICRNMWIDLDGRFRTEFSSRWWFNHLYQPCDTIASLFISPHELSMTGGGGNLYLYLGRAKGVGDHWSLNLNISGNDPSNEQKSKGPWWDLDDSNLLELFWYQHCCRSSTNTHLPQRE